MGQLIQLTEDLSIGKVNHQREYGSRINNAWLAERKAKANAASAPKQSKRARNYAGAKLSRLNGGWGGAPTPANWHIWNGLQQLRSRSREQYRNNDYARKFIGMCKSNIVGHQGVQMQSRAVLENGEPDKTAQAAIEGAWREWSRAMHCDVAGKLSFVQMQQLIVGTVATDGECLIQKVSAGAFGFQLKLIDPELLDLRLNVSLNNGNRIRMGVEMDKHGKPVAYHLLQQPDDVYQSNYYTGKHVRVPASEMLHIFLPEMIEQARGVSWMASALVRMKNLHGYEEAAVIAARIGASKMGFYTSAEGQGAEGLADDEDVVADEFIQEADPGAFEVLPEGYDFKQFNPDYPHQQFGDFIKATLRGIGAGLGVSYNGLSNDLENVNFSSIRAGVLEEREQWKTLQSWFIDAFMRPVFEGWLNTQLAIGTIRIPARGGFAPLPASQFERFRQVSFQGRRWAWVDPLKDMKANEAALQMNLKSRAEIIREMGRDPDEVWEEIKKENEKLASMGLSSSDAAALLDNALAQDAAEVTNA